MNKKTMKIAIVAVVAAVAGTVTYQNQIKKVAMSELVLANVEALASSGETGNTVDCYPAGSMSGINLYYKLPSPHI